MVTDTELLSRYANEQSNAAFAEFVERNLPIVYSAALRRLRGHAHLADEVCQVVFTQAARKAARLSQHPTLLGWLHTSTRYAVSALVRQEHRRVIREQLAVAMHLNPSEPEPISWEALRPLIDGVLDTLGATDRQAVLLRFFVGRTFAEIGAELKLSEEASRKRVARALEIIRTHFARRGVTTTSSALAVILANVPLTAAPPLLAGTITTVAVTATTGSSMGLVAIGLMSTAKLTSVTTALSLAGITALGTALFLWSDHQNRTARQLAATEAQVTEFRVRLREIERKPAAAISSPLGGTSSTAPAKDSFVDQQLQVRQILGNSAEYAAMHREEMRLRIQRDFGGFLENHNYSSEQLQRVRDALVAMYLAQEEEWDAFTRAPEGSSKRPDVATDERVEQILAKLRSLVPEEDTAQLRRGFGARTWMRSASSVSADLADAGIPISQTEERALAIVLSEAYTARRDPAKRARVSEFDTQTGLTFGERAQLDDAAAFLTQPQLKIFEQYLRDERAKSALTKRVST